jgi:CheY-like chemotaxis protein
MMTHILVVDPNEAFATLLREELTRQGYDISSASTFDEALAAARNGGTFALALLDMDLEPPGAVALAHELRDLQPDLRLMFIPLIGERLDPEVEETISFQGVLPKPFFLPELPSRIEAALQAPLERAPAEVEEEEAVEPEAEVEPATVEEQPTPAPSLASSEPIISAKVIAANRREIQRAMKSLTREVGADGVLLTSGDHLAVFAGSLTESEAEVVADAVFQSWATSSEVARILGREQVSFEQSICAGEYTLYAQGVDGNVILAVVIRSAAALGLLRHRTRGTADEIALICVR